MSALLRAVTPEMKHVIVPFEKVGLRDKVKTMVGCAPVNEKYAIPIGADGYARDAGEAVSPARRLMQGKEVRLNSGGFIKSHES